MPSWIDSLTPSERQSFRDAGRQHLIGEYPSLLDKADELLEEKDPTPYCSACGAKLRKFCHCGPIAENE